MLYTLFFLPLVKNIERVIRSSSDFKIIALVILCLISGTVSGQKLIESRQTSYYTYIYKITNKEARKVYKKDIWKVDPTYFHTLVDSFLTDDQYTGKLPAGHYLKTYSEKNKQMLSIASVPVFDVLILNNNTDLCIQVYDLKGNIISDAKVKVGMKNLGFDRKTQSYIDKKSNQKGLLKVSRDGITAFFDLSRQYNNSGIKRGTRKIVYGTPVKYIWMPVRYIIYLPIDGVRSIVNGWPQGTINRTKNFFVKTYEKVACIFDDSYCNSYSDNKFKQKHTGYIVFNKPKYLPGDTVKFKAFLMAKKGKPVNETVNVILNTNRKSIQLTKLKPYREGGYEYSFFLHDSLDLVLDRSYYINIELNGRKKYIGGSFQYEEYELSKNKLEIRVDSDKQYKGNPYKVFAKGTDENSLNLMDSRLEIFIRPKQIKEYFNKYVFIPDTLLVLKMELDPNGETEIPIPDSIFPDANLLYEIQVRLLTSDNEALTEKKEIEYYHYKQEYEIAVNADSLQFVYKKNGITESVKVKIIAADNFGNETEIQSSTTPCKLFLNPYYKEYIARSDSFEQSFDISLEPSQLQCLSERTNDSIFIVFENPGKLPFSYTIYKKNNEQARGYTDSLSVAQKTSGSQNYFVSLRYLWGGKIKEENYRIPYNEKTLKLAITQSKIVYPGQKTKIEILVTDVDGHPVEGVDLTAYSLTKKFDYSAPQLPYLGEDRKNKSVINNFNFKDIETDEHPGLFLDYEKWKIQAGLDSIEYYKFIYPENRLYSFEYVPGDSLTQFAPFVMSKGAITPIHVIYIDNRPVYFSWSTNDRPYSFKINPGYHQLKLRTKTRIITMDSVYINKGKKLVFSMNDDLFQKNIRIAKAEPELSKFEKRSLYNYVFPYRYNFGDSFAFLESGDEIQLLNSSGKNFNHTNLAGPVAGNVTFKLLDDFSTNFVHEPFFEYDFAPGLLKMRNIDEKQLYPKYLNFSQHDDGLSDLIFTRERLNQEWKNYLDNKRFMTARYRYPSSTTAGAGKLLLGISNQNNKGAEVPINILVFRYDNPKFIRVYPGNATTVHQLEKGLHKLVFFYSGAKYFTVDSIDIQTNGLNYRRIQAPAILLKDAFSVDVNKIIETAIFKNVSSYQDEAKEMKQIYESYQMQYRYTGNGSVVDGFVYDAETGDPLPGATILVKGTSYGALADLNGYYSIKLPQDKYILQFSFVGCVTQEINVGYNNKVDVRLMYESMAMEEIVVIGYGTQRKSNMVSAVVSMSSSSLTGAIPGLNSNLMNGLTGKVSGIQITTTDGKPGSPVNIHIRGANTATFQNTPLYIINGNVYTGNIDDLNPDLIESIELLQDASATAIYGSLGVNGVVIIKTKGGSFQPTAQRKVKGAEYDQAFFEAASESSSIRENFSDYAFWQPKLITDKQGKASFEVTFPDDVTSWQTIYLAMNDKKQSGQTESIVKSYKPLMAQLAVPRFLVQTDTTFVIGKVLNYTSDSLAVTTNFEVDEKNLFSKKQVCINSIVDTLTVIAKEDSLKVKYYLQKPDGYFDGELKVIPVYPIGLEETKGDFVVLDVDTTLQMTFDTALGNVSLYAAAGLIDVVDNEIKYLVNYKYSCNEQLASKLKALLAQKLVAQYKDIEFKDDKDIEKIIHTLLKNQKEKSLWGWWPGSATSYWISLHVMEALSQAKQMGFMVRLDENQITTSLIWELEGNRNFAAVTRILRILRLLNSRINYETYIKDIERIKILTLNEQLQLLELKQLCGLPHKIDTLVNFKKKTMFGNIYFSDNKSGAELLDNDVQNTILAYRILKNDTTVKPAMLIKIRNYFLETRRNGNWLNTYQSSQIIETILPDLLGNKTKLLKPTLHISGDVNKSITDFPFELKSNPIQRITISKTGDFPVYFTSYQRYWNYDPQIKNNDLIITTSFNNEKSLVLKAAQETKLIVTLEVLKDADYIMINIPIPGGCSYAKKGNNYRNEVHREYFKNETTIFCERLGRGKYTFEVDLIPRYSGIYTLNPAKVELMYFPTFNANNERKKVTIK